MIIDSLLKRTRYRLVAALLFGFLVGASNLYLAWRDGGNTNLVNARQSDTIATIMKIDRAMTHYRLTHPHPPATLAELGRVEHFGPAWKYTFTAHDAAGRPVQMHGQGSDDDLKDAWGRPLQYRATKSAYVVMSFGRDGKADGTGSNMDLMTDMRRPRSLSFKDFLGHDRYSVVVWSIVFMGWIAGLIAWKCLEASAAGRLSTKRVIRRLVGASVLMWFLSVIFTALGTFDGSG